MAGTIAMGSAATRMKLQRCRRFVNDEASIITWCAFPETPKGAGFFFWNNLKCHVKRCFAACRRRCPAVKRENSRDPNFDFNAVYPVYYFRSEH